MTNQPTKLPKTLQHSDNRTLSQRRSDARQKLAYLRDAAKGQPDLLKVIDGLTEDVDGLVHWNHDLQVRLTDALWQATQAQLNRHEAVEDAKRMQENAVQAGLEILAGRMRESVDMHPKHIIAALQMLAGELPEGTVDTVPPALLEDMREVLTDIIDMCLSDDFR